MENLSKVEELLSDQKLCINCKHFRSTLTQKKCARNEKDMCPVTGKPRPLSDPIFLNCVSERSAGNGGLYIIFTNICGSKGTFFEPKTLTKKWWQFWKS